jgi:hemerythrin
MSFQWTEDLRTGVDDIDAQHRELILQVNTLLDACSHQKGRDDIGRFLSYLSEYVAFPCRRRGAGDDVLPLFRPGIP